MISAIVILFHQIQPLRAPQQHIAAIKVDKLAWRKSSLLTLTGVESRSC